MASKRRWHGNHDEADDTGSIAVVEQGEYCVQAVLLLFDLLIKRSRSSRILLPAGIKRRGTRQLQGAPLELDPEVWPGRPTVSAETRGPRKFGSEILFCFPALRFDAFSPYRDSECCGAPKPGKEKHKSYDYRSAILIVHRFRSFLSVFTS